MVVRAVSRPGTREWEAIMDLGGAQRRSQPQAEGSFGGQSCEQADPGKTMTVH
jgi:hypothetical protein